MLNHCVWTAGNGAALAEETQVDGTHSPTIASVETVVTAKASLSASSWPRAPLSRGHQFMSHQPESLDLELRSPFFSDAAASADLAMEMTHPLQLAEDAPEPTVEVTGPAIAPPGDVSPGEVVHQEAAEAKGGAEAPQVAEDGLSSSVTQITPLNRSMLFEQVFGKPILGKPQTVLVPWSINRKRQGEMGVKIGPGPGDLQWNASYFLETLGNAVQPELQQQLEVLGEKTGSFSPESLANLDIQALFNPQDLTLDIQLTPEQLRTNVIAEQGRRRDGEPTVQPANLSGYINTRGGLGWTWLPEGNDEPGRQPISLQWDGALNYKGWVVEGQTRFQEGADSPWKRGDFRLVRDRPDLALRFNAGEISSPTTGYQRGASILGVSATRQFGLQPDRVTRPISNYEFFLEAPSKVEVFINGDRERILDLPAGTQDLRDFSLGAGINDIELVITDPVGRERRLQFFAPVTAQLLAPGIQQFAYSLGAPIEQSGDRRRYDFAAPLLTASHRWGVTPTLTTGLYLQANLSQQMIGSDGVMATALGNWDWNAALSLDPDAGLGYGATLGYDYRRANDPQQRSLQLGLEYRSPTFLAVGDTEPGQDGPLEASLSYRQKLMAQVKAGLTGRYQWGNEGNAYRVSLDLSRPVGEGRQLELKLSHAQRDDGATDQQMRVNLRWSMPQRRQTLSASTESNLQGDFKRRLSWSYRDRASINAFNTGLNLSEDGETWDLSHRLAWRGYRATIDLNTDARGERQSMLDWSGMESQLNFGTALVFADGRFGWSQPVGGSFALVVPHPSLRGQGIDVNPSPSRPAAVVDRWGGAVLSGLSDYRMNSLNLDAPNLPLGYSLGGSTQRLRPGYRQGTLITVGNDATVFLRGVLHRANGDPAELVVGEVRSLNDSGWTTQTLFTNRVGKFALEGFKPGRYQLQLTTGEGVRFEIPPGTAGLYRLNALSLEPIPTDQHLP